jgi:taurine--2-oxoglutarate transaminase
VGVRRRIADQFNEKPFPGGLTYSSHTLACAAALATLSVYEEDGLIEQARARGRSMAGRLVDLQLRHPCVGAVRSIGLFGAVELIRNSRTREPLAPFNGSSPEMAALGRFFREQGLFTFVRFNYFFTNPPLSITEQELREGFEIIDRGLSMVDGLLES